MQYRRFRAVWSAIEWDVYGALPPFGAAPAGSPAVVEWSLVDAGAPIVPPPVR